MLLDIFMGSIFILFINFIMKDIIFKYIEYIINYYNFTNLKLICGTFERPPEAKNCGIVYLNEKNFSYERGMPSGHSLVAAYLATCLYRQRALQRTLYRSSLIRTSLVQLEIMRDGKPKSYFERKILTGCVLTVDLKNHAYCLRGW